MYLNKFRILRHEALVDLNTGCYNKAVSALWFSLEALLKALIIKEKKTPPEKSGKLIGLAIRYLFHDISDPAMLSRLLISLHYRRLEIDHRRRISDKEYAEKSLEIYNKAIVLIREKYPWISEI